MYEQNKICFFCLCENKTSTNTFRLDKSNATSKQITYVLPELTISESEIPINICSSCHATLNSFYTFKNMCLNNYGRYKDDLLQESRNYGQLFSEYVNEEPEIHDNLTIQEEIKASLPFLNKRRVQETSKGNIKKDSVVISLPKNSQNNYLTIITKDCILMNNDNKSFSDKKVINKSKLLTSLLYSKYVEINKKDKKFKCLMCNQQFPESFSLGVHVKKHLSNKIIVSKDKIKGRVTSLERNKNLKCLICNKQFKSKRTFNVHSKYHVNINKNHCPEYHDNINKNRCPYNLRTKSNNKDIKKCCKYC